MRHEKINPDPYTKRAAGRVAATPALQNKAVGPASCTTQAHALCPLDCPHLAVAGAYGTHARPPFAPSFRRKRPAPHLNLLPRPIAMSHQIHTYSELRQQIHDDLPIQHPEWVEPNGESLMCLMKLLDSLTQREIQRVYRYSSSRLRTGTKPARQRGGVIPPEVN